MTSPPDPEPDAIDWACCSESGCIGVAALDGRCVRHVLADDRAAAVKILDEQMANRRLDLRGVEIDKSLLDVVLVSAPIEDEVRKFGGAQFDRATFTGDASFAEVRFTEEVSFYRATFAARLALYEVVFEDTTSFRGALFKDVALDGVEFKRSVLFDQAEFDGQLEIARTTFSRTASFKTVSFRDVALTSIQFVGDAIFEQCVFDGTLSLMRLRCGKELMFIASSLGSVDADEVIVLGDLWLDRVTTTEPVTIRAGARTVFCRRARFERSVSLQLARAEVMLDWTTFAEPSVLTSDPSMDDEKLKESCWRRDRPRFERTVQARILSLQRADVEKLTLGPVDLMACRFSGAYHPRT